MAEEKLLSTVSMRKSGFSRAEMEDIVYSKTDSVFAGIDLKNINVEGYAREAIAELQLQENRDGTLHKGRLSTTSAQDVDVVPAPSDGKGPLGPSYLAKNPPRDKDSCL